MVFFFFFFFFFFLEQVVKEKCHPGLSDRIPRFLTLKAKRSTWIDDGILDVSFLGSRIYHRQLLTGGADLELEPE